MARVRDEQPERLPCSGYLRSHSSVSNGCQALAVVAFQHTKVSRPLAHRTPLSRQNRVTLPAFRPTLPTRNPSSRGATSSPEETSSSKPGARRHQLHQQSPTVDGLVQRRKLRRDQCTMKRGRVDRLATAPVQSPQRRDKTPTLSASPLHHSKCSRTVMKRRPLPVETLCAGSQLEGLRLSSHAPIRLCLAARALCSARPLRLSSHAPMRLPLAA
jgi:hypothetical protein